MKKELIRVSKFLSLILHLEEKFKALRQLEEEKLNMDVAVWERVLKGWEALALKMKSKRATRYFKFARNQLPEIE